MEIKRLQKYKDIGIAYYGVSGHHTLKETVR
jgi:hypothetical protein